MPFEATYIFQGRHTVPTVAHTGHKVGRCRAVIVIPAFFDKLVNSYQLWHYI